MLHMGRLIHHMLHMGRLIHHMLHMGRLIHHMLHMGILIHYMLHMGILIHYIHHISILMHASYGNTDTLYTSYRHIDASYRNSHTSYTPCSNMSIFLHHIGILIRHIGILMPYPQSWNPTPIQYRRIDTVCFLVRLNLCSGVFFFGDEHSWWCVANFVCGGFVLNVTCHNVCSLLYSLRVHTHIRMATRMLAHMDAYMSNMNCHLLHTSHMRTYKHATHAHAHTHTRTNTHTHTHTNTHTHNTYTHTHIITYTHICTHLCHT